MSEESLQEAAEMKPAVPEQQTTKQAAESGAAVKDDDDDQPVRVQSLYIKRHRARRAKWARLQLKRTGEASQNNSAKKGTQSDQVEKPPERSSQHEVTTNNRGVELHPLEMLQSGFLSDGLLDTDEVIRQVLDFLHSPENSSSP